MIIGRFSLVLKLLRKGVLSDFIGDSQLLLGHQYIALNVTWEYAGLS